MFKTNHVSPISVPNIQDPDQPEHVQAGLHLKCLLIKILFCLIKPSYRFVL